MNLIDGVDQTEHDQVAIDCFFKLWQHSADFMFIMAVENDGEFSLFDNNPASKAVMGLPQDVQIHRMNIRETWGDAIVEGLYETYQQAIEAGKPISIIQNATNTERDICVDTMLVPIFDASGEAIYVCGVSRDVTNIKDAESIALKANEKLLEYSEALKSINEDLDYKVQERTAELENAKRIVEESLEAKSAFVARMSHEIRTPINAVIGLSDLALKTTLDEEQKDLINKILSSGENLLSLVNDVLDFSKIEAGKMAVEQSIFSPHKIIEHVINMIAIKAKNKNLSVTIDISPSLPEQLVGDALRIQQILVNLVTNAVKFTLHGGVCVRMYTSESNDDKLELRCDVIDTGIGLSKESSKQLFQSFQQADDSITRQFGGTGLGLTISQQLCELMGGSIWVNSEIGQGSTFSFTIPLRKALKTLPSKATESNKVLSAPNLSKNRVLLVEDNIINQKVILGYLEDTLIKVDIASNGQEAIERIEKTNYDLVFMDIQMPVMDGLTAAKKIRQCPEYNQLPIIAMTAHVSEEARAQSLKVGMNDHLDKPIEKQHLYKVLQNAIGRQIQPTNIEKEKMPNNNGELSDIALLSKLSAIKTLDTQWAINNFSGNMSLYLDLIYDFHEKYKDLSFLTLLDDNLDSMIHSLKSNTAYIGAFSLSSCCAEIEQNQCGNKGKRESLEQLDTKLKQLVEELNILLTPYESNHDHGNELEFCESSLINSLESIVHLLKKSDFSVEHQFVQLRIMVKGTEYEIDIEQLIDDIENIEFEIALDRVASLLIELQGK